MDKYVITKDPSMNKRKADNIQQTEVIVIKNSQAISGSSDESGSFNLESLIAAKNATIKALQDEVYQLQLLQNTSNTKSNAKKQKTDSSTKNNEIAVTSTISSSKAAISNKELTLITKFKFHEKHVTEVNKSNTQISKLLNKEQKDGSKKEEVGWRAQSRSDFDDYENANI